MANGCCSIELEPRTLKEGQLNHAREIAADVVEKLEPHEASLIFVEGLRSANSIKKMTKRSTEEEKVVGFKEETQIIEIPCQCTCTGTSATTESPEQDKLKEPLSAPF